MVTIDICIFKEQDKVISYLILAICLFITFLTVSGCSKSGEGDSKMKPPPDISTINESLKDYRFTRQDFNEPQEFDSFLHKLVVLYYDAPAHLVCSSIAWRMIENGVDSWLQGAEKSEAVLKKLCRDPEFMFEGNKWIVVFNVLKPDGSVDKWKAVGEHDPENNTNRIEKIEVAALRPKGTFFVPLVG
jgi:hypothetical protein